MNEKVSTIRAPEVLEKANRVRAKIGQERVKLNQMKLELEQMKRRARICEGQTDDVPRNCG